jgi:hypothetical protein
MEKRTTKSQPTKTCADDGNWLGHVTNSKKQSGVQDALAVRVDGVGSIPDHDRANHTQ